LGRWTLDHRKRWLSVPVPRFMRPLGMLGRWSLSYYMLHQPVMIGLLMLVAWGGGARCRIPADCMDSKRYEPIRPEPFCMI
ncbi:MAG: DUF1624 domain-containing protein, partial [Gammaproteobacteria bacterium]|nr:DUF1624 domain-containing protein [Gammaproteobacteria bacterium]